MTCRALVVGAGVSGLSAAAALGTRCENVTVVEARSRGRGHRAGEHVPPAGLSEMALAGFSDLLSFDHHDSSLGVRSAWGEDTFVDKEYFMTTPGRGINLRRRHFDEALAVRAERSGAKLCFRSRLENLRLGSAGYVADVRGPLGSRTHHADVVVDATGRRAAAAGLLGVRPLRYDRLVGLVGRLTGCAEGEEVGRVQVESAEDGWWYGIQFSGGTLVAAYMTDASELPRHPGRALELWQSRLPQTRLLAPLAATGQWCGRVEVFDAATQLLTGETPAGFLAVGDAAAAYDPLSSWGITKAVCDGNGGAIALVRGHEGDESAVIEHRHRQRRDFEDHRSRQLEFYRAETRWPKSPFWCARQGVVRQKAS